MATDSVRLEFVKRIRKRTDAVLLNLPLPKINPNHLSAFSVFTSLLFIIIIGLNYKMLALILLFITLLLDWFDGLIARKYGLASEEGYVVDVTADRISEGIIFSIFFVPWFFLFAINLVLTLYSFRKKVHVVIPLRHIFLVAILVKWLVINGRV